MFSENMYPEVFYQVLDASEIVITEGIHDLNMQNYPLDGSDDSSNLTNSTSSNLSPSSGCPEYGMSPPSQQVPQLEFSPASMEPNIGGGFQAPHLVITLQPADKFRYRYESEMCGMHGSLGGKVDIEQKRSRNCVPTVELKNYDGNANITCTLVQNNLLHNIHAHRLVRSAEPDAEYICEDVSPRHGYIAKFAGMAIIHTAKKKISESLYYKHSRSSGGNQSKLELRRFCEDEATNIKLNTVCLCFTAYDHLNKMICPPVYSSPIDNMKSAETGELKIVRMSKSATCCTGGEEVFFFIEKVSKKNIKIRFFETDDEDNRIWEAFASFSELDVHHQYGIVFKTPAYKDTDITSDVNVYVELYRPKDQAVSLPKQFRLKVAPRTNKRRRPAGTSLSSLFSTTSRENSNMRLSSDELSVTKLPLTVAAMDMYPPYKSGEIDEKMCHDRFGGNPDFLNDATNLSFMTSSLDAINRNELIKVEGMENLTQEDLYRLLKNMDFTNEIQTDGTKKSSRNNDVKKIETPAVEEPVVESSSTADADMDDEDPYTPHDKCRAKEAIAIINSCTKPSFHGNPLRSFCDLFSEKLSRGDSFLHMFVTMKGDDELMERELIERVLNLIQKFGLHDILNMTNDNRETALHKTVTYVQSDMMELLLSAGCNPNLADDNGNTPLHLAVKYGSDECMSCLFNKSLYDTKYAHKLDVNIYNNDGLTPLLIAALRGSLKSVSILLRAGADCNLTALNDCRSALHYAVESCHTQLVKYILKHGDQVPVNALTQNGCTAFHYACILDDPAALKICEILLEFGADPMLKHKQHTGLDLARQKQNDKIVAVIEKHLENKICVKEEIPEEVEIKEELNDTFLDGETLEVVANILNKRGNWKLLAHKLNVESMILMCEEFENPARMLLTRIEIHCDVSARTLLDALKELEETEAVNAINKMMVRVIY